MDETNELDELKTEEQERETQSGVPATGDSTALWGAFIALGPLALSFVPYISYFVWVLPLAGLMVFRRNGYLRLASAMSFCLMLLLCGASLGTKLLSFRVGEPGDSANTPVAVLGMALSLIQLACVALAVIQGYKATKHEVQEVPGLTVWMKKLVKYSGENNL